MSNPLQQYDEYHIQGIIDRLENIRVPLDADN